MAITVNVRRLKWRDKRGGYRSVDFATDEKLQDRLNAIQQKGEETLATIPEDYTTLNNKVMSELNIASVSEAAAYLGS